jgi:uncharacterized transporter YbjL
VGYPGQAVKLADALSGGRRELDPGQFNAVRAVVTRFHVAAVGGGATGQTAIWLDRQMSDAAVEAVVRDGKGLEVLEATVIQAGDLIAVSGTVDAMASATELLGAEALAPAGFELVEESRELILTNPTLSGRNISEIHDHTRVETRHGVFLTRARRMGLERFAA